MMDMLPKCTMRRDPSPKSCKKLGQTPIISLPDWMHSTSLKKIYNTNNTFYTTNKTFYTMNRIFDVCQEHIMYL